MSDVTQILSDIENGDPKAAEQLLPFVCDELYRIPEAMTRRRGFGMRQRERQLAR